MTLQFVSCFCSNHQISTEEFGCLLLNLLESSGKFEFEIEFKLILANLFFNLPLNLFESVDSAGNRTSGNNLSNE